MKLFSKQLSVIIAMLVATWMPFRAAAQSCGDCHTAEYSKWVHSVHANTQLDVASELSQEDIGWTPDAKIQDEDCIACHAPTAVLLNGGMTEGQALGYFFTTSNGVFTAETTVTNTTEWPNVNCATCHDPMSGALSYFNSQTGQYEAMTNAAELCGQCHGNLHFADTDHRVYNDWLMSKHANTQTDVADELSHDDIGWTPDAKIKDEDCIACHAPTAVLANGGMTEGQALGYFFTTDSSGQFSAETIVTNAVQWPQVACVACHDPHDAGKYSYFNSATGQYEVMTNATELCAQCHGNLRFPDTDHQVYNGWLMSKHANTQTDVADELSHEDIGWTPNAKIKDEDCIACHAPTAVLANGGMTEGQALGYFFTTDSNDQFSADTTVTNSARWPQVACIACHNPHGAGKYSYFNSATGQYEVMTNTTELCAQCHGNLRFPDTDHLSYNIRTGTGGIGVPDQQLMPDVSCVDCHMYDSGVDGSWSAMYGGHTWATTVPEAGGADTMSCLACHTGADEASANLIISGFQGQFQSLDATTESNVTRAAAALQTTQNANWLAELAQAEYNMTYAESDESGGFHNYSYLMALLNNANTIALSFPILDMTIQNGNVVVSWTGTGTLQSASSITGPWNDVPNATNPLAIPPTGRAPQQFYRLRQ